MKVADPERIAIGGHSYGAFMTANLLAHSRLFRAGVGGTPRRPGGAARDGAGPELGFHRRLLPDDIEHGLLRGEYFILGLFAVLGMMVLISAYSLLSVYLGLELLSLSLYSMVALHRDSTLASEAAMKYFVLGAFASAFFLYGIAFVYGATGSIGSAAVQLLKARGAVVTAVCATGHVDLVQRLGADRVIDYTSEDFTADVQAYDLVIDAVGKTSFGRCRRMLKPDGIYVSSELGPLSMNPLLALLTPAFGRRRVQFPLPMGDQAMVRGLGELIASGGVTPVIDRRFLLDEIVAAYGGQAMRVRDYLVTRVVEQVHRAPRAEPGDHDLRHHGDGQLDVQ